MLRVLEVISDMNIGGAGRLLLNRVKNTDKERFELSVIIPKGSMLLEPLSKENIIVYEIDGGKNKSFEPKSFLSFFKLIKRINPDIINSHGSMNARISAKLLGIKVKIFTRHCDFPTRKLLNLVGIRGLVRFFNGGLSDGAIAVSSSARDNLLSLGINEEKIKVIINGAEEQRLLTKDAKKDLREKMDIGEKDFVVGIFARLEPYKDHITFLKAASVLKNKNCRFLIVGTGSRELEIKEFAKALDVEGRVSFVGFVDDVSPFMNITDVNVNCSVGTETSSLALSEGMSLGIPAIVSDYSGNTYMVKDNVNGMVFPQKDYFKLAKKIDYLMENKEFYRRLSVNARTRFEEELNAFCMTKKTEAYYLELYEKKTCKITGL